MTTTKVRHESMERLECATDPEVMYEQQVNMNRRLNPLTAYNPISPVTPRSESSGSAEIVEGPRPEVIDLSIDEIEAMFITDVTEQTTHAEAQANSDAAAEEEARRSGKPVMRKKTDNTSKSPTRKGPPGPDPNKGRRLT
jgi:hypothetical protein